MHSRHHRTHLQPRNSVFLQARNYERRKQQEKEREQLFEGALKKFNAKDIEGVCRCYT
jgi:hypothetical protein